MGSTLLAIDIGSTDVTAIIAKNDLDYKINILGTGIEASDGINKGLITNIELASKSIQNAVLKARRSTSEPIESTVVAISGSYTKGIRSMGSVNVPNGIITEHEINQVMQMALYNATIVPEYEVVHVIPIFFKVDDSADVDNPLNMNGARLEVSVYIVTAKRTALTNLKSAFKESNIEITNFVLNGYATAISVLDEQQNKFGSLVINMGSTTTEFVCYKGGSILYTDFIPVGSNHITNDLSVMLHTPHNAAELIKIKYGSLLSNNNEDDHLAIKKIKIPRIGDEQVTEEISLVDIRNIIHARVEETLILVKQKLSRSGIADNLDAGIVITGGMSKLKGIRELATLVFENQPVKVANPKNIKNGYMNFDDSAMATIVGLLFYSLDKNRNFELDSNKKLRRKIIEKKAIPKEEAREIQRDIRQPGNKSNVDIKLKTEDPTQLPKISKTNKGKGMARFWNKVSEWF
ncbi:cell division protein FtsA [Arcobacter nitrofigilis DSM 7299]|uniref:Cell division protein FtsA n=1 Tax=Arcobacter nitrofigilis (strain ATCC 33309 / DSM 7299 / CCUG 15893 / LMG 7604 / NCTC 12251 / CI) TaxID=572480 RepID=D5V202_ARCNC|nr:cell division protein FtsA [Arcobacter nitrofigilis]ADG93586.1 cell division protein FtsA [Arcobacter nitrofigilis DSM 7299]